MKNMISIAVTLFFFSIVVSCRDQNKIEFFVSQDGNDTNPGTKSAPFLTLEKAKDAVRLQKRETPDQSILVYIKGGNYYLSSPIIFTAEDSGKEDAPVVYKAVKDEKPVFTGSRELKDWRLLENPEKLKILNPEVKGKVYVCDLNTNGISNFGDATDLGKRSELFCNGEPQTLARWPNTGFVNAGLVKGKTGLSPNYLNRHGSAEGIFEYTDQRQNHWAKESDARLEGYWFWDWSDEFQKVDKVDSVIQTIYLKEPYHHYGYRDSLRYFGLNLFCELDQPAEWYLDRTEGLLYWFPSEGIQPETAKVTLSVFDAPFMIEMNNCSHVILEGLTFQEGRGSAVSVREGSNCVVSDCRIERFGRDGIHIEEGVGHRISGCYLSTLGCGGMKIKGGDRKTLTPASYVVENTVVESFSLYKRTYEPAVYMEGCGIEIRNNRFRNSSSSAMRLEGNDFTIEYNEISQVVNESDDQGGIDIFYNPSYRGIVIRNNHWFDIKGGTLHGAAGVRLDDMISGVTISGNIFERCGAMRFGGVQIHGGKDNLVENNLFYHCLAAVSFSPWGEQRWFRQLESPVIQKKLYEDVDIRSELYQNKYPQLKNIREDADLNTIRNNLLVDCENIFLRDNGKQVEENNNSIQSEGKDLNYFCSEAVLNKYGLQPIPVQKIGPQKNKWIE